MLNSPRVWMERELKAFAESVAPGSLVLDAGSGDQRYRSLFSHCRHESADFEKVGKEYAPSTYVCDLTAIPVEDGRFDAVVFTQVMEHLPEPSLALAELKRVLKPGGRIFCTAPLFFEEHEPPYDFYRFTQFGMRHLFEKSGLRIEVLRPLDGYMSTVAHQLRYMGRRLPWWPSGYAPGLLGVLLFLAFLPMRILCRAMAPLAARAGASVRYTTRGIPMNYLVIAARPSD